MIAQADELFVYDREPDPSWVAKLAMLAPPSDDASWLEIHWWAGWKYEPVQRFCIYEVWPVPHPGVVPAWDRMSLEGENPRTWGVWTKDPDIPERYGQRRWNSYSTVYYEQWKIHRNWRQHREHPRWVYPKPFWIIQGTLGGHKYRLSDTEQKLLVLKGAKQTDTPAPGDLPYAPFDWRCLNQLLTYTRLQSRDKDMSRRARGDKSRSLWLLERFRGLQTRAFREELARWLENQVEQFVDETYAHWRSADLPEGDHYYDRELEHVEHRFLTDDQEVH